MFMQYRKELSPYRSKSILRDERIEIVHPMAEQSTIVPGQDFYVIGRFHDIQIPEDAHLLVKLVNSKGQTVRISEAFVRDNKRGINVHAEDIFTDMTEDELRNSGMPDLVYDPERPDSYYNTWNKVYYTEKFFGALIYGGTYDREHICQTDQFGAHLSPLEEDEYILIVELDLPDGTISTSQTLRVMGGTKEIILSRYTSPEHAEILRQFAEENGFSGFSAPYPGIWDTSLFHCGWIQDCYIEIPPRWEYADSMEYLTDKVHCFDFNLSPECVGYRTEIGAMLHQNSFRLEDMEKTKVYYYKKGYPTSPDPKSVNALFGVFHEKEYLAVTDVFSSLPDPCKIQINSVVKPIPSETVQISANKFRIMDRIETIRYTIKLASNGENETLIYEFPVGCSEPSQNGNEEVYHLQSRHSLSLPGEFLGKQIEIELEGVDDHGTVRDQKCISFTPKPQKPELVLCDVDGTLIDNTQKITPAFHILKDLIQKEKIPFTIATGRSSVTIQEYLNFLEITMPVLVNNGACVISDGKMLWQETFSAQLIKEAILAADKLDMAIFMCMDGQELVYRYNGYIQREMDEYNRYNHFYIPLESEWPALQFERVMITDPQKPGRIGQVMKYLEPLKDKLTILNYDSRHVDIMKPGISKGWAIRRLAKHLGIDTQKILVIGDGANDMEMVREVGMGAAVANANQALKENADYVCKASNTDGVIEVLKYFYC